MKKVLCIFVALCFLTLGMTMAVFAEGEVILSVDNTVECLPGATSVPVAIEITENPGISNFFIVLTYDTTKVTPVSYSRGSAVAGAQVMSNLKNNNGASLEEVSFMVNNKNNFTTTGTALTVLFDVDSEVSIGTAIDIEIETYDDDNTLNDGTPVGVIVSDGQITVKGIIENYTFEDDEVVYDGTAKGIEVTNLPAGVDVDYTYEKLNEATSEYEEVQSCVGAGTYRITADMTGDAYFPAQDTATLTITPATIVGYTFEDATVTYDETAKTFEVTAAQDATEGVTIAYECDGEPFAGATVPGEYEVTATITKEGYTPVELTATLTIEEAEIVGYSFADATVTYNGAIQNITVEAAQGATQGVTIAYECDGEPFAGESAVGEYEITATITKAGYEDLELTATLTIEEAEIDGYSMPAGDQEFDYDGDEHSVPVEVGQDADPEDPVITYTYEKLNPDTGLYEPIQGTPEEPGQYKETVTIEAEGYETLELEKEFTINPGTIEGYDVSDDQEFEYDGDPHNVPVTEDVDATPGADVEYSYQQIDPDTGDTIGEPTNEAPTAPGTYVETVIITADNYDPLELETTFTITPGTIEGYTFEDDEVVYDTTSHTIEVTAANDATEDVTIVYTCNGEPFTGAEDAGTYTITATISKAGYNDLVIEADLVITPAPGEQNPAYIADTTFPYTYAVNSVSGDEVTGDIDLTGTGFSFVDDEAALAVGDNTVYVNYTSSDPNYYDVENAAKVVTLKSSNLLDVYDLRFEGDDTQWYSVDANNQSEAKIMAGVKYYINDVEQDELPEDITVTYSLDGENYEDDLVVYEGGTYTGYAKITADGYTDVDLDATFRLNYMVGDVNVDGYADVTDAQRIAQYRVGGWDVSFTYTEMKAGMRVATAYDKLTAFDVTRLLQFDAEWPGIEFGPAD
ncbi:MAG: hypothetical protein J5590_08840 [Clostridia bacterium]|nr:hypothetical protein [Clostridia bacterium]